MKTNFICADPPWTFKTWSSKGKGRSPEQHYDCMSMEDLCALPVIDLLSDDALLFLWTTFPLIFDAPRLALAWGFAQYSGSGFVWVKTNKTKEGLSWGLGYGTRKNAECCLVFKRGNGIKRVDAGVHEVIMSPKRKHSQKPDDAYTRIEKLYGNNLINPVELFARERRDGWYVWGDEVVNDFEFGSRR